jgi:methylglutaconyl-CoA hydratase
MPVPVVAAVKGRALAGGCGLASACDLILASESARFGYPEVRIGFVPAMVLAILRRNVSEKRAFELTHSRRRDWRCHAKAIGLVNQVFADQSFEADVLNYVSEFKKMSRSAVALTKSCSTKRMVLLLRMHWKRARM